MQTIVQKGRAWLRTDSRAEFDNTREFLGAKDLTARVEASAHGVTVTIDGQGDVGQPLNFKKTYPRKKTDDDQPLPIEIEQLAGKQVSVKAEMPVARYAEDERGRRRPVEFKQCVRFELTPVADRAPADGPAKGKPTDPPPPPESSVEAGYAGKTVAELQELIASANENGRDIQPASQRKADLIAALEADDAALTPQDPTNE